jgi:hypothetical protein
MPSPVAQRAPWYYLEFVLVPVLVPMAGMVGIMQLSSIQRLYLFPFLVFPLSFVIDACRTLQLSSYHYRYAYVGTSAA